MQNNLERAKIKLKDKTNKGREPRIQYLGLVGVGTTKPLGQFQKKNYS